MQICRSEHKLSKWKDNFSMPIILQLALTGQQSIQTYRFSFETKLAGVLPDLRKNDLSIQMERCTLQHEVG